MATPPAFPNRPTIRQSGLLLQSTTMALGPRSSCNVCRIAASRLPAVSVVIVTMNEMGDHLGVGVAGEPVATLLKLVAQLGKFSTIPFCTTTSSPSGLL